ncbi:hypothetical protein H0H93_006411 [Arthromyces matolae]|nr:hypothetical protein H0H93_006411 [Arthromyces matolae]
MLEGYSVLHRKPEVYSIVYIAEQVGLEIGSLLTVERLNTYDAQSRVPFLLNILPSNLDKEDANNNQSVSFRWFRSFVELYFSPTTELELQVVVESVHEVVKFYHRKRSYISKTRSHNLFATTESILDTLKASLNQWTSEKASDWISVFEACLLIIQHIFPTRRITELHDATDLRWCLQIVIPILRHITEMVPFAQLQEEFLLPSDLKDILRSETANAVLRRVDDPQVKGAELLEICRSIDPSL